MIILLTIFKIERTKNHIKKSPRQLYLLKLKFVSLIILII